MRTVGTGNDWIRNGPGSMNGIERASVILPELEFRKKPTPPFGDQTTDRVIVSRWKTPPIMTPLELVANPNLLDDSHIVTHAFTSTHADLYFYGREFHKGQTHMHNVLLTGPGQAIRTIQRATFDGIRMYLPQALFAESFEHHHGRSSQSQIVVTDPAMVIDPVIWNLMEMVCQCDEEGGPFVPSFIEAISIAIASRMLHLDRKRRSMTIRETKEPLVKWRLKRVCDYVEANLSKPIHLAELGGVAGLSRMRFAAQFRAATGFSPHEFILRRKVERAKELMSDPTLPLADIASLLGFRSQGHFSQGFKKYAGDSPSRWRYSALGRFGPEFPRSMPA